MLSYVVAFASGKQQHHWSEQPAATRRPCSRLPHGWEDLQGIGMGESNDSEVPVIQGRDLPLAGALRHRQHGRVDEAESQIGVCDEQFAEPDVVRRLQTLDDECAALDVPQEGDERAGRDEMVEFHQHGRRNQADAVPGAQQLRAASVVLIIGVEQRHERPGVDYERNGGGS